MENYDFNNNHHWEGQDLQNGDFDREEPVYIEEPVYTEHPVYEEAAPRNKIICTILLIVINVMVYWRCQGIAHYSATGGANYRDIVEGGEYGRLLSCMFLHVDFTHLYCNMIALFLFGKVVEEELGSFKMFLIYFISGIGSGICSIYFHHMISPTGGTNSIGASGAIYALIVSAFFLQVKRVSGSWIKATLAISVYIIADISLTKTAGVDLFAHLGGAAIGFVLTLLILCFQNERKEESFVMKVLGIGLTLCLSLIAVQEAHLGEVSHWSAERIQFIQEAHLDGISDVSFGEALEEYCSETKWTAFLSDRQREIVELNGKCSYQGRQVKLCMQFILNMDEYSYQIAYLSLDGISQTDREITVFLQEIFTSYEQKHGLAANWQQILFCPEKGESF